MVWFRLVWWVWVGMGGDGEGDCGVDEKCDQI